MTAAKAINIRKHSIVALFIVIGGLSACYMYFVSLSIVHVVLQKEAEQSIARVSAKVGALESTYLAERNAITENTALSQGFIAVSSRSFASRQTLLTTAAAVPRGL